MTEQAEQKTPMIFAAIANIGEEIGPVGKEGTMKVGRDGQTTVAFRRVDDVINALHPLLRKHRLFSIAELLKEERTERKNERGSTSIFSIQNWKYTYYAEDGSSISTQSVGEGFDTGDKASVKAQSVAWRIAMCHIFHIPYEELMDSEAGEQHEVVGEDVVLEKRAQAAIMGVKDRQAYDRCYQQLEIYAKKGELTKQQVERLKLLLGEREREIRKTEEEAEIERKASDAITACVDRDALKEYEKRIEEYKKLGKLSALRVNRLYAQIGERVRELRNAETKVQHPLTSIGHST